MNRESLDVERKERGNQEKLLIAMEKSFQHYDNIRFEKAHNHLMMSVKRSVTDVVSLYEAFIGWMSKLDKETEKYKVLNGLSGALLRLDSYVRHLETINCQAVSDFMKEVEDNEKLVSKIKILELEMIQLKSKHELEKNSLEKEIEFITKNG